MIFIIVIFFILVDIKFNDWRIDRGNKINHYWNGVYRIAFYSFLVWEFNMNFLQALMFLLGAGFLHWILFNIGLNFLRHKPLDYLGKDSILDRLEAKVPWIVALIWKIIAASGFIYGYFNTQLL